MHGKNLPFLLFFTSTVAPVTMHRSHTTTEVQQRDVRLGRSRSQTDSHNQYTLFKTLQGLATLYGARHNTPGWGAGHQILLGFVFSISLTHTQKNSRNLSNSGTMI